MQNQQTKTVRAYGDTAEVNIQHNWLAITKSELMGKTNYYVFSFLNMPKFVNGSWQADGDDFEEVGRVHTNTPIDIENSLLDISTNASVDSTDTDAHVDSQIRDAIENLCESLMHIADNLESIETEQLAHELFCREHGVLHPFAHTMKDLLHKRDGGSEEDADDDQQVNPHREGPGMAILAALLGFALEAEERKKAGEQDQNGKPKFS